MDCYLTAAICFTVGAWALWQIASRSTARPACAEIMEDAARPHVLARAAIGDEAARLVSSDDGYGECPDAAGIDITWQQAKVPDGETSLRAKVWSGEVLFTLPTAAVSTQTRLQGSKLRVYPPPA